MATRTPISFALALVLALPLASNAAGAAVSQAAAPMTLYLATTVNGTERGLQTFTLRAGKLYASPGTLRKLRIRSRAAGAVPLSSLPGLRARFDSGLQTLALTAPLALLDLPVTHVNTDRAPGPASQAQVSPGALLNYSLYGSESNASRQLSGFFDARAFGRWGTLDSTELLATAGNRHATRLDTSWQRSWPDKMLTLRVGDTLTSPIAGWSRQTHIGGVQIGTDFSTQPYFVTTPLPEFFGQSALPSTVQLFVDGVRRYSGKLPAGPYSVTTQPGISGAGQAQLVVTDALGQATALSYALYATPQLLRPGLTDWSAAAGFVREGYGLESFDYASTPAASASWRRGITPGLTLSAHGEATAGLVNAGGGGDWLVGKQGGVFSWSAAASRWRGLTGTQVGVGYSYTDGPFDFGGSVLKASAGYRDVASLYGSPMATLTASAHVGFSAREIGNVGVSFTALQEPGLSTRYASLSWRRTLGRHFEIEAFANRDLRDSRDSSIFAALDWHFGQRTSGSVGYQRAGGAGYAVANAQQGVPSQGGWGWRAQAQDGGITHAGQGEVDYQSRFGYFDAGAWGFDGATTAYAGAQGSIVLMDHHVFAARQVGAGFAVVSTSGIADVPVLLQNNPEGKTGRDGLLLLPILAPYQANEIGIDPLALPAGVRIGKVKQDAVPEARAGVIVPFDIARIHAATVTLTIVGKAVPVGSVVKVKGASAYVGYSGEMYLDTLAIGENTLDVTLPNGTACTARVDYPAHTPGIPHLLADCARGGETTTRGAQP